MPKRKGGRTRGRRHGHRMRTSSQSSVEIQVTTDEAIITTTATATVASGSRTIPAPSTLVQPRMELLQLLKAVGAKGHQTSKGEFFSFKQLCSHFTEYLKKQQLWDPYNPYIIHCQKDPLSAVFNVPSFTFWDTRQLLTQNLVNCGTETLLQELTPEKTEDQHTRTGGEGSRFHDDSLSGQGDDVVSTTVPTLAEPTAEPSGGDNAVGSCHQVAASVSSPQALYANGTEGSRDAEITASPGASTTNNPNCTETEGEEPLSNKGIKRKRRKKRDRSPASPGSDGKTMDDEERPKDGEKRSRTRGNSISLVFSGSKWWIPMITQAESDDSEILSIQSKETACVQSSSDDIWFLDEEEVEINIETAPDPPFPEEYEVMSDNSSSGLSKSDLSESPDHQQENYVLVYAESDVEFWADSESSDCESDESTDMELSEADKWRCTHCNSFNSPLQRNCDLCWHVRPGWLPEKPCAMPRRRSRPQWQMGKVPRARTYRRSRSVPDGMSYKSSSEHGENEMQKEPSNGLKESAFLTDDSPKQDIDQLAMSTPLAPHAAPVHTMTDDDSDQLTSGEDEYDGPSKPTNRNDAGPHNKAALVSENACEQIAQLPTKETNNEFSVDVDATGIIAPEPVATDVSTSIPWIFERQVGDRDLLPLNADSGVETESLAFQSQDSMTSVCAAGSQDSGLASQSIPSICSVAMSDGILSDNLPTNSTTDPDKIITSSLSESTVSRDVGLTAELPSSLGSSIDQSPISSNSGRTVFTRSYLEEKRRTRVCLTNFQTSDKPRGPQHESQEKNDDPVPLRRTKSEPASKLSPVKCDTSSLCSLCLTRPKEASIIHGRTGHQMCCYKCAKRLRRRGKPCPVCRRPIKMIIKNFIV